jgi:DNA-binding SARP family transcriptional activator/DNA-binding HxlR family transcriptional regulator
MDSVTGDGSETLHATPRHNFSPERALEAVGDRWALRIIRVALFGEATRFSEFQRGASVEPDILSSRLDGFVGAGLMDRVGRESDPDDPEYVLTAQGRNLEPVIIALTTWGDGWNTAQDPPIAFEQDSEIAAALRENLLGASASPTPAPVLIEMTLLGAFSVRVAGKLIEQMSVGSQRLLVFLALHHRAVTRIAMAGRMWPEASDERAGISLRSALSRLDTTTREAILSASSGLSLVESVAVDLRDAQAMARRLLQPGLAPLESDLGPAALTLLSSELLPDWYDDWVLAEAEDWRQLRMNALEAQAMHLTAAGRLAEAAGSARAAMKVEPLRESSHASLIKVHLAEGNQSEALRVYERYRVLLKDVLGLQPTERLSSLVSTIQQRP